MTTAKRMFRCRSSADLFAFILLSSGLMLVVPSLSAQELASLPCCASARAVSSGAQLQQRQEAPPSEQGVASAEASKPTPSTATQASPQTAPKPASQDQATAPPPQPKRILGVMPNFRAVSAGVLPPPPTPKQAFVIATKNSFDYSAFVFVGITSLLAEADNAHPQLGKGIGGYGEYYWRGYVDKTDGNYWVIFVLPTIFHQDERYYALGKGGVWKRGFYSASRIFVTPNYHGHRSFNVSELLGRAIAQAISVTYYPSQTDTGGEIAKKYGFAIGRDMLTDVFREFWPDIDARVLHHHQ
jgi:hypothetical protein